MLALLPSQFLHISLPISISTSKLKKRKKILKPVKSACVFISPGKVPEEEAVRNVTASEIC